jgi:hypothetical protein
MHTIDDGMVKGKLEQAMRDCDSREVAKACSTLFNRGKQTMIVDTCLELANLVHPKYAVAILANVQRAKRTSDDTAELVATCVSGIRESSPTAIVPHLSKVIVAIVNKAEVLGLDVSVLKRLPLRIGKKWAPIASVCLRMVSESVEQHKALVNKKLERLFQSEAMPVQGDNDAIKATSDQIDPTIKMSAMWTFVRQPVHLRHRYVPPLIADPECEKVIRNIQTAMVSEQAVTCLRS